MIPGPVEVEPEVLAEMSSPQVAHYGEEWVEVYNETLRLLKQVFQTKNDVFLLVGSGSAGLDAAIGSLAGGNALNVPAASKQEQALILSNGFFGERLVAIASSYTDKIKVIRSPLNQPIPLDKVEEALKRDQFALVAAVHCETSTGVLNPVAELGELCQRYGAILIVDAISSLGGIELRTDDWHIGICVSASQKCLESPPGLCPIAVSPEAWHKIDQSKSPGWYLNLRTWKDFSRRWSGWHPHPITMAVNNVLALKKSLELVLNEGLQNRFARHARIAKILRQGLRNLGFELFVADEYASNTVTTVWADSRISAERLLSFLREEQGIRIAGGLEELKGKVFRIGHMGPTAKLGAILPLLFAIEEALRSVGADIKVGQSLRELNVPR